MTVEIILQNASKDTLVPPEDDFTRWAVAACQACKAEGELTLRLIDLEESQSLNHNYRAQDKPTNVLSFPFENPPGLTLPLIGDIAICVPLVKKEAQQQQKSEEAHFAHLVIHGCLHCLGYDHVDPDDAEQMESLEITLLTDFNFPNPYGALSNHER